MTIRDIGLINHTLRAVAAGDLQISQGAHRADDLSDSDVATPETGRTYLAKQPAEEFDWRILPWDKARETLRVRAQ